MDNLYERIDSLCKEKGINITLMCKEAGVSRGSLTDLKVGRNKTLKPDTLSKIASFFHVSVDYLLGNVSDPFFYLDNERIKADINSYEDGADQEKAPTPEGERDIGFDDFTYAFNGEVKELTESDKQLLLSMARQLNEARKQRDGKKTD